jgi:hypothetical protein
MTALRVSPLFWNAATIRPPRSRGCPADSARVGPVACQKGRSSEPSVVSPALWLPEFDS